ncbi:MAG: hypothetical protein IPN86_01895 [Saprospiraceae bacterium]|nr:hypothetical protein [Saprospiraceae bacterium]
MKVRFFTQIFVILLMISSYSLKAQFDDLYYDYSKDQTVKATVITSSSAQNNDGYTQDEEEYEEQSYDNQEYDNYDEYSYSTRIRRFHRPVQNVYYSSFDNWWADDYYDPYYSNNGVNIFIGNGWNSWNRPWGYSYWNRPWGWNSWNSGWGWNSWNNPYAWNSGWGWNSYNNCSPYGYGNNYYYGNVYYGNGNNWNGNGWNNANDNNNKKVYGSRKGGSLASSTAGRDASPRRIVSGGNAENTQVDKIGDGSTETSSRSKRTDRSYRGDIRSSTSNTSTGEVKRSERSRIYTNPDRSTGDKTISPSTTRRVEPDTRRSEGTRTERSNTRTEDRGTTRSNSNRSSYDSGSTRRSETRSPSSNYDSGSSRSSSSGSYDSGRSSNSGSSSGSSRSSSSSGSSSSGSSRRGGG